MQSNIGIVAVGSLCLLHIAVDDARLLTVGHYGQVKPGRFGKHLVESFLAVDEHIACT